MSESFVTQEEIMSFQMPPVYLGQHVSWFKAGRRTAKAPEIGTVVKISRSGRNVTIQLPTGKVMSSVKHVDDPKLQKNPDQREDGAWDYTDAEKKFDKELGLLKEAVLKIAGELEIKTGLEPPSEEAAPETKAHSADEKSTGNPAANRYHELRRQVVNAGIPVTGNPPREELEQLLREHQAQSQPAGASA